MKAGIYTPVVTAFDEKGNVDVQANRNIYEHLICGGVDGIVVMGSTGEFFAMTEEQKKELIRTASECIRHRVELYVGTGCMRVSETVSLSNYALEMGADAVMVVGPYYFALSPESIEAYFDEVAEGVKGDIYLYNYPERTGYDLTPEVTLRLLKKHSNIKGYKDTVTEMGHTRKLATTILPEFPEFRILSGFDENMVHNILSGGSGCIGGLSNLYPEVFAGWVKAINSKDADAMEAYQKKVDVMMDLYDIGTPFIPIMKKAMILRGVEMGEYTSRPFLKVSEAQEKAVREVMRRVESM